MSELSLYQCCLRKVAISLRDGIYRSCDENPFSVIPSTIVNHLVSAVLDHQLSEVFRAQDLEQLLKSGQLKELKMDNLDWFLDEEDSILLLNSISQVLFFLLSGCQKLEIFHLESPGVFNWHRLRSDESVARISEISENLENLFRNTPNLESLNCGFSFDLKALRYCLKLRKLELHFEPRQHWYEFLLKEDDHFQPREHLEFFAVSDIDESKPIPYDDIVVILRHCPNLTTLGDIESSGALSQLHRMGVSPSELKLQDCNWNGKISICEKNPYSPPNDAIDRIREAVLHYPMIKELTFEWCFLKNISDLRKLQHLVSLTVKCADNISGAVFNDALQAIGPQLKILSFHTSFPIDLSALLQNLHSLESCEIFADKFTQFAYPAVKLPNLKYLYFFYLRQSVREVFRLFYDCNKLTELCLQCALWFDDETLNHFLKNNSLSNLKVALLYSALTERGFRELLLNAPQLEKVDIPKVPGITINFERIIRETNHMVQHINTLRYCVRTGRIV